MHTHTHSLGMGKVCVCFILLTVPEELSVNGEPHVPVVRVWGDSEPALLCGEVCGELGHTLLEELVAERPLVGQVLGLWVQKAFNGEVEHLVDGAPLRVLQIVASSVDLANVDLACCSGHGRVKNVECQNVNEWGARVKLDGRERRVGSSYRHMGPSLRWQIQMHGGTPAAWRRGPAGYRVCCSCIVLFCVVLCCGFGLSGSCVPRILNLRLSVSVICPTKAGRMLLLHHATYFGACA